MKKHNMSKEGGVNTTVGLNSSHEKFKDGSNFKIKFVVSDIIKLSKDKPVEEKSTLLLRMLLGRGGRKHQLDKNGRFIEESLERALNSDLSYPILVVQNERGRIFGMLDGTHRLEKAFETDELKIKVQIFDKEELKIFKSDWKVDKPKPSWR